MQRTVLRDAADPEHWPLRGTRREAAIQRNANPEHPRMGLLTFSLNVTLDGCIDHQVGIADDETHAFFTRLMDEAGAMLWGRVTNEKMEGHWPAAESGDLDAPPARRVRAHQLNTHPTYAVRSS